MSMAVVFGKMQYFQVERHATAKCSGLISFSGALATRSLASYVL